MTVLGLIIAVLSKLASLLYKPLLMEELDLP